MTAPESVDAQPQRGAIDMRAIVGVGVFAYSVLVLDLAMQTPLAVIANATVAASVVLLYVRRVARDADVMDRRILAAFILYAIAGVFSLFPRQSLDAALGGLLCVAALFVTRGLLAGDHARRLFATGLMALSALFTAVVAVQWIPAFVGWWSLTEWAVVPPLDLRVIAEPWGYRHDMALLLVLLYPSWWTGRVGRLRAIAAIVIGAVTGILLLIDGSRTLWLATALGSAVVLLRARGAFRPSSRRRFAIIIALIALIGAILLLTEAGAALSERLLRSAPIGERGAIWSSAIDAWSGSPVTGAGPGSFPWLLQTTSYFDTNSFIPRHADSAPVQLLAEVGLVGIAAAVVVLAAIAPAVYRGKSRSAAFALTAGLTAATALNPTVVAAVVAVGIGWVSYGAPRDAGPRAGVGTRFIRWTSAAATSFIAAAFLAMVTAHTAYVLARDSVLRGDLGAAESQLQLAVALDPALALYHRQLGTLYLVDGRPSDAVPPLARSIQLNPSDDLALRVLGAAHDANADLPASTSALREAVAVQRSDPTNLLMLARALLSQGDHQGGRELLAEVVQAWPLVIAAPGWDAISEGEETTELLQMALERWHGGSPSPEPRRTQPLLIALLAKGSPASPADLGLVSPTLRQAYQDVNLCGRGAAAALSHASDADRRTSAYWALVTRLGQAMGVDTTAARRLYRTMTGDGVLSATRTDLLSPLHENGANGFSADAHGYGRLPIDWPHADGGLPSPSSGFAHWHLDPSGTARDASLVEIEAACLALSNQSPAASSIDSPTRTLGRRR